MHRVDLLLCMGIPKIAENVATDAEERKQYEVIRKKYRHGRSKPVVAKHKQMICKKDALTERGGKPNRKEENAFLSRLRRNDKKNKSETVTRVLPLYTVIELTPRKR